MMRILKQYSPIVIMMQKVFFDFQDFIFFLLLIIMFLSVPYGVIQFGVLRDHPGLAKEAIANPDSYPGFEYKYLSYMLGYFLMVLRFAMADTSNIETSLSLSFKYDIIFWVLWLLTMIILNVIFLNFVITKAMHTYEEVSERIDEYIIRDRTNMIAEAD